MKRLLIASAERAWAWAVAWVATPAGQRAAAAFALVVLNHLPGLLPPSCKPWLDMLTAAVMASGVLHASRQGPGS